MRANPLAAALAAAAVLGLGLYGWAASERVNDDRHTATVLVTTAGVEYDGATDAHAAAIEEAVSHNTRSTAHVAIAKNTWTALSGIGNGRHRYLQIFLVDDTASETAVVTVWGSEDGGTTYFPMVRADTLADAKSVTLAVGTERIGSGDYSASVVVAVGPATHIYLQEKTAPAAGTYTYQVGGL